MVRLWIEYDRKARKEICVIFDKEDLRLISPFTWYPAKQGNLIYITMKLPFLVEPILMHRWIMNAPDDKIVHHLNHNTLDNRRANLMLMDMSDHTGYHAKARHKGVDKLFSIYQNIHLTS